jgi:hypothetical protein
VEFKMLALEKENGALKSNIASLERENEILKSSLNTLSLAKRTEDEIARKSVSPQKAQVTELRGRIEELTSENEHLRGDIIKLKEDMFQKYDYLQKSNDDLLVSYDERFKLNMKNLTDRYEGELSELRQENAKLREFNTEIDSTHHDDRERMNAKIFELERDKQDLLSKISQANFLQENTFSTILSPSSQTGGGAIANASNYVIEQIMKEKNEAEKKYNELMSSYECLLEHNKSLVHRFEKLMKDKDQQEAHSSAISHKERERPRSAKKELSVPRRQHDYSSYDNHDLRSSLGAEGPGVGKIRRNKELQLRSASINSSSIEDDKPASRSLMKPSDLSHYTSTILKPKNHFMDVDELKYDVSNFEDKLRPVSAKKFAPIGKASLTESASKKKFLLADKENHGSGKKKVSLANIERPGSAKGYKSSDSAKGRADSKRSKASTPGLPSGASSMRKKLSATTHTSSKGSLAGTSNVSPRANVKYAPLDVSSSKQSSVNHTKSGKIPIYSKVKKP